MPFGKIIFFVCRENRRSSANTFGTGCLFEDIYAFITRKQVKSPRKMTIRPYQSTDFDACIALFKSNMPQFFLPEELPDYTRQLEKYKDGMPYKGESTEAYFIVEEDGAMVACGGVYMEMHNNLAGMVWGMVDNGLHRKGIGRQFLLYRIDYIREHCPACKIRLDTTQHSRPFFEKYGFEVVKYTENGYGEGMHRYDMVLGG